MAFCDVTISNERARSFRRLRFRLPCRSADVILLSIILLTTAGIAAACETCGEDSTEAQLPAAKAAGAQSDPTQGGERQSQGSESDTQEIEKKGEWLAVPIPISSPSIGSGLEWAVARVFPFDKNDQVSPPSAVGIGGVFTNNGSRAVAVGGRLYLKHDKYRLSIAAGAASVNFNIYGIGKDSGNDGIHVPLNADGSGFLGEFLHRLRKGVYLGVRGQFRQVKLSLNEEELESSDIASQPPESVTDVINQVRGDLLNQRTVSMGPRFQWDSRDNVFYPKQGVLTEFATDFFSESLGSKFTYQYYKLTFNKYSAVSKHQILAFRGMACAAAGDRVPIYDLCLFGTSNDLRGYPGGRFQDRRMFATQGEYRLMLPANGIWGRIGVVAFGGVGAIGDKFSSIGASDLLPAGGAGIRFRLLKKYPINFRVDYGIGKVDRTLSIGVLEAF